ncbi:MAG TPA: radical SAM protein [Gemmatimonadaceae bacterium]|nr:radical SAM protein [Gemmatimonadaceae bacterium]
MLLGFAVTRHCNLRCPHCIRDDVVSPAELEPDLIARVIAQAQEIFGEVRVTLTGGEPLIHRGLAGIIRALRARGVRWGFVTNGWHVPRALALFDAHPPSAVRLSLSGASERTHDAERGRGSFRRVLLAAADLAESLGALALYVQLAQPTMVSASRGADLTPADCYAIVREVRALGHEAHRRARVGLDYGAPPFEDETPILCDTFAERRLYVNHHGELSLCCQLSEYGAVPTDIVADLHTVPLARAFESYRLRLGALRESAAPDGEGDALADFPCLRCARASGKLTWLARHAASPWREPEREALGA